MTTCKKDIRRYNFNHRIINIWNSLPEKVVTADDVRKFEAGLDAHWQNQSLLYDDFKSQITI